MQFINTTIINKSLSENLQPRMQKRNENRVKMVTVLNFQFFITLLSYIQPFIAKI